MIHLFKPSLRTRVFCAVKPEPWLVILLGKGDIVGLDETVGLMLIKPWLDYSCAQLFVQYRRNLLEWDGLPCPVLTCCCAR